MPEEDRPSYWIVICPEPYVRGGVWGRWYRENCVAAGWPPPNWSLDGPSEDAGWVYARNRLKEIRPGDRVIPFLLKWRIGPVGTVTEVRATDAEWNQTVEKGNYSGIIESELGRRVLVTWEQAEMPPQGKCALVPPDQRPHSPLSKHTIERLPAETFHRLCSVLSNRANWIDVVPTAISQPDAETEVTPPPPPVAELALLERDLQKFLARNLGVIEKGLAADPDYQLEQYDCDVGRLDFLCKDAQNNWVVIELKADWAAEDAVVKSWVTWVGLETTFPTAHQFGESSSARIPLGVLRPLKECFLAFP